MNQSRVATRTSVALSSAVVDTVVQARRGPRRRLLAATVVATTLVACGGEGDQREAAQPAPDVTTFQQGQFDQLPQFPRSDAVGPRTDKNGVVARSYRARGTTPELVLDYYRRMLDPNRWTMSGPIEKIGVSTYRADWVSRNRRLRISATREPQLADDAPSDQVTVQYSLTLGPA